MAKTYNRLEIDVNKKPTDIITAVQADSMLTKQSPLSVLHTCPQV